MNTLILDCGDAIQGESRLDGFANKVELLSFSHGIAQPITGDPTSPKRTSGKPRHQDFTVTKHVDLASCQLTDLCNTGTVLPSVRLTLAEVENNNDHIKVKPIITYQLSNALVSSVSVGGANGDGKPQETVTFNYTRIAWTYVGEPPFPAANGNNAANLSANLVPDVVKRESKWSLEANRAE